MQEEDSPLNHLVQHVKQYVEARIALAKLDTAAGMSAAVSSLAKIAILLLTASIVIVFLSVGMALLIGKQLGEPALGYLCVAGFFLLVGIILYARHDKWIQLRIANEVLKRLANDK